MKPYVDWCTIEEIQFGVDIWIGKRGVKVEITFVYFVLLFGLFRGK